MCVRDGPLVSLRSGRPDDLVGHPYTDAAFERLLLTHGGPSDPARMTIIPVPTKSGWTPESEVVRGDIKTADRGEASMFELAFALANLLSVW